MIKNFQRLANSFKQITHIQLSFYSDKVIDHYEKPRNVGSMNKNSKNIGTGLVGAPACGDVMKLQIKVSEDGHTIEDAVFKVLFNTNYIY